MNGSPLMARSQSTNGLPVMNGCPAMARRQSTNGPPVMNGCPAMARSQSTNGLPVMNGSPVMARSQSTNSPPVVNRSPVVARRQSTIGLPTANVNQIPNAHIHPLFRPPVTDGTPDSNSSPATYADQVANARRGQNEIDVLAAYDEQVANARRISTDGLSTTNVVQSATVLPLFWSPPPSPLEQRVNARRQSAMGVPAANIDQRANVRRHSSNGPHATTGGASATNIAAPATNVGDPATNAGAPATNAGAPATNNTSTTPSVRTSNGQPPHIYSPYPGPHPSTTSIRNSIVPNLEHPAAAIALPFNQSHVHGIVSQGGQEPTPNADFKSTYAGAKPPVGPDVPAGEKLQPRNEWDVGRKRNSMSVFDFILADNAEQRRLNRRSMLETRAEKEFAAAERKDRENEERKKREG